MVKNEIVIFLTLMGLVMVCKPALALPTFTRQTGQPCATCHLNVSELTPAGRTFKLHGYSEGRAVLPLSVTAVGSLTKISSTSSSFAPEISLPKNGEPIFETASLYAAGRYWDNLGGYLKLTLNAANIDPLYSSQGVQTGTRVGGDVFLDTSEFRYSESHDFANHKLTWGITANNAPGVEDLWETTPVYGFPYQTSQLQNAWGIGPLGPTALVDGGLASQMVALGFYGMLDDSFYAVFSNYRSFHSGHTVLELSGPTNTANSDFNPYWRLSWNAVKGDNSIMAGTFGMVTNLSRDPLVAGSAKGKYVDLGFDTEFQHITNRHSLTASATFINEQVSWGAHSLGRSHDSTSSGLWTLKAKMTYDYSRTYGVSLFGFRSDGSTDKLYWAFNPNQSIITGACNQNNSQLTYCSLNGSPRTAGTGFEMYYVPIPYVHVALQQTFYSSFLGGETFVDNTSGNLRKASDNNLTYLYLLVSY